MNLMKIYITKQLFVFVCVFIPNTSCTLVITKFGNSAINIIGTNMEFLLTWVLRPLGIFKS